MPVGDLQEGGDRELEERLRVEQQKAQLQARIHSLTDMCWDKCMDKPSTRLDDRTETCLTNCVERFLDTSVAIATRFTQTLQKSAELQ
ncbi:mitochondrial import inner membrane translocase subunit Tim8 [Galendromus occidentalis]|uniref:Mitochondrial import inner membrane translocase subunit n=1 Tax=Galendromus occidentalis TaxID=34638 RepID=A0AAJ6QQD3_9ACAR|nr:mitochondrial import inner membrane translocase subunit Tim8 [Galendromus occidentalis]